MIHAGFSCSCQIVSAANAHSPTLPNSRALPTPCACCDDPHPKILALERERKPSEDEAARDGASSTCERKLSEDEAGRGSAS